jgi:hypothetical protein
MKILKKILPIIVSALLLWIIFQKTGTTLKIGSLLNDFLSIKKKELLLIIFSAWVNFYFTSERFKFVWNVLVTKKNKLSSWQAYQTNMTSFFLSIFIPYGPSNDLFRLAILKKITNLKTSKIFKGILYDRTISFLYLILFGLFAFVLECYITKGLTNAALPKILLWISTLMIGLLIFLIVKYFYKNNTIYKKTYNNFSKFFCINSFIYKNLYFSLAYITTFSFFIWVTSLALGLKLDFLIVFLSSPFILFLQNIPFFFVGFGAREIGFLISFSAINSNEELLRLSLISGSLMILSTLPSIIFIITHSISMFRRK